jgi:cytochrome bd-type quinol oxidase subunit 2
MRKKLAIALLVAWAGGAIPACILASLDENRPPTQVAGWGVRVAWFLPMVAAAGWCAFRALKGHRRKEAFDKVLLSCTIVFVIGFSLSAAVAFLNKCLDHSGMAMEMTVTDVFILRRTDHHDERLVAVSLPAQAGGTAVWLIANPEIALAAFPIGSKARIISHNGYFGVPWCEYIDHRFPQYHWQLSEYHKSWRAQSAIGQFSAASPCKEEMVSWGIPVSAIANLNELSPSERGR